MACIISDKMYEGAPMEEMPNLQAKWHAITSLASSIRSSARLFLLFPFFW